MRHGPGRVKQLTGRVLECDRDAVSAGRTCQFDGRLKQARVADVDAVERADGYHARSARGGCLELGLEAHCPDILKAEKGAYTPSDCARSGTRLSDPTPVTLRTPSIRRPKFSKVTDCGPSDIA